MAESNREQKQERKPATPAEIGKVANEVAATLAGFTPQEQWRVIRAVSTINGIEPPRQQQGGKR